MTAPARTVTQHPAWCNPHSCTTGTHHTRHASLPRTTRVADVDVTFSIVEDHDCGDGPLIQVETFDNASLWPDHLPIHGKVTFTPTEFEAHCREGLLLVAMTRP